MFAGLGEDDVYKLGALERAGVRCDHRRGADSVGVDRLLAVNYNWGKHFGGAQPDIIGASLSGSGGRAAESNSGSLASEAFLSCSLRCFDDDLVRCPP